MRSLSDRLALRRAVLGTVVAAVAAGLVLAAPASAPALAAGRAPHATGAAEACAAEATLHWGFKESFRAYIDGAIANGRWTVSDGAQYATPEFAWGGSGRYDGAASTGRFDFRGAVEFTGHGGVLDTTISAPRLSFDGPTGTLRLDVVGTTQDGVAVAADAVDFAQLDLASASVQVVDGVLVVDGITATLTDDGAAAFGTYPAGEPLDPMTLEIAGCDPVVPPDLAPRIPLLGILAAVLGGAVVIAAGVFAVLAARRRRRARPPA
ncbi:MAG: HtaA domain-containing protein [Actinomycetales bacterium]|nr:HtaA domain-containing protein [Actinomycetales bacterium]